MRKASFPDSYKPIVRKCFRRVAVAVAFSLFRCFRNQIYFIMIIVMTSSFACYLNSMSNHWWFQMETSFIHTFHKQLSWIKKEREEKYVKMRRRKTCDFSKQHFLREHNRRNPFHSIISGINAYTKKTANGITQENENILYHALALLLSPLFFGLCSYSFIFSYHHRWFSSVQCTPLWQTIPRPLSFTLCLYHLLHCSI